MKESWPEVDATALEESKKEIIIQINGKLRGKIIANINEDDPAIKCRLVMLMSAKPPYYIKMRHLVTCCPRLNQVPQVSLPKKGCRKNYAESPLK